MKKLMMILTTSVVSMGLAVQANAQTPNVDTDQPPSQDVGDGHSEFNYTVGQQLPTSGTIVIGRNFTIEPGQFRDFRLVSPQGQPYNLDPSSIVDISILTAPRYNLGGTFLVPFFAAPGARYTAIDLIDCSQFNFNTQGGEHVPVYGTHLVVRVYNLGYQPVSYYQLMVHFSGH